MAKLTKNRKNAEAKIIPGKVYSLEDASSLIKEVSTSKFDGSVDLAIRLGVDPRKANQMVRGVVSLPNGSGKTIFVWPNEVEIAWEKLKGDGIVPRGVMFWNAKLDQMNVFNGTKRENYTLAGGFNEFLKVR